MKVEDDVNVDPDHFERVCLIATVDIEKGSELWLVYGNQFWNRIVKHGPPTTSDEEQDDREEAMLIENEEEGEEKEGVAEEVDDEDEGDDSDVDDDKPRKRLRKVFISKSIYMMLSP